MKTISSANALLEAIKEDIKLGLADYAYEETIELVRLLRKLDILRRMTPVKRSKTE